LGAVSTTLPEITIFPEFGLRPAGIPFDDRRRVIVVVETLESLTYHGYRWFSGY
jgi:hypothetical protein